jgi:hypothetical protein
MFRTPHVNIRDENPVFDYELRRVKRLATPGRLWLYSAVLQAIPLVLIPSFYFLSLIIMRQVYLSNSSYYTYGLYSNWSGFAGVTLFGAGVLAFFGGIYYMAVSIYSINKQINDGHWDMLRLSPLAETSVLRAKETIAHIRAWRLMQVEVALRLTPVIIGGLLLVFDPRDMAQGNSIVGQTSFLESMARGFAERPLATLAQLVTLVVFPYVWIMEPRWRMKTITALGLALSARVRNLSMASVAAFFGLLGFHVAQAVLLIGTVWVLVIVADAYYAAQFAVSGYYEGIYAPMQIVTYLTFVGTLYFTYWAGRRLSWHSALRQAFKPER